MYFDFDDYRPDIQPVGSAISLREGALLSLIVHALFVLYLLFGPRLPSYTVNPQATARIPVPAPRPRESPTFVFVQPKHDLEAPKPPPLADNSDKNREARTRERAEKPTNSMPFSRGNTRERVEAERPREAVRAPEPSPATNGMRDGGGGDREKSDVPKLADASSATALPSPLNPSRVEPGERKPPGAALGEALRHLERYVQQDGFENPGGGGQFGPAIQFDTKGVEFGPWIRRFVAQIKRNWFIPYAAMSMKGHVVVTFYVHKDGSISALAVQGPSAIDAFNNSAFNALASSNPTQPLPPEYPADKAFFTVTFYYNEAPPY